MKINLKLGQPPINGYVNLDPLAQSGDTKSIQADLSNLDQFVDANECSEILALYVLDFFPLQMRPQILMHWMSKVAHDGTLTLSGLDIREAARLIHLGYIDNSPQITDTLYGPAQNLWTIRKGVTAPQEIIDIVLSTGQFRLENQKFDNLYWLLSFRRN